MTEGRLIADPLIGDNNRIEGIKSCENLLSTKNNRRLVFLVLVGQYSSDMAETLQFLCQIFIYRRQKNRIKKASPGMKAMKTFKSPLKQKKKLNKRKSFGAETADAETAGDEMAGAETARRRNGLAPKRLFPCRTLT
uniref:Uncharacterized protein n=1 Tax=Romanomermis culicivorax TaxID=13658 RepID=A0A915IJX2_ROMCU